MHKYSTLSLYMLNNEKTVLGFLSNVCAMLYTGKNFSPAVFPVEGWRGVKNISSPKPTTEHGTSTHPRPGGQWAGPTLPPYLPTYTLTAGRAPALHHQHQPRSTTVTTTSTEEQTPPRHTHLPARLYLYTTGGRERPQNAAGAHAVHTTALHLPDRRSAQSATQRLREQEITVYSSMPGTSNLYSPGTWRKSRKQRLRPYRLDSVAGSIPHPPSKPKQNRNKFQQVSSKPEATGSKKEVCTSIPATWSKPCNGKPWKVLPTEDLQTAHEVNGRTGRGPRCWKVLHSQERQPDRRRR